MRTRTVTAVWHCQISQYTSAQMSETETGAAQWLRQSTVTQRAWVLFPLTPTACVGHGIRPKLLLCTKKSQLSSKPSSAKAQPSSLITMKQIPDKACPVLQSMTRPSSNHTTVPSCITWNVNCNPNPILTLILVWYGILEFNVPLDTV